MEPLIHPSNNTVMKAPEGYPDCVNLSATRCPVNGVDSVITFWRPTEEELELLNKGGPVALVVYSPVMPMVWVTAGVLFEESKPN